MDERAAESRGYLRAYAEIGPRFEEIGKEMGALRAECDQLLKALRGLLEAYDEPLDDERDRAEAARAAITKAVGARATGGGGR